MPADLWQGSTAARIDVALAGLTGQAPWATARGVLRDLLATEGPAPAGADTGRFADRRAAALLALGDARAAVAVADAAGHPPPDGALLLAGDEARACAPVLPAATAGGTIAISAAAETRHMPSASDAEAAVLACHLLSAGDAALPAGLVSAAGAISGVVARAAVTAGPVVIDDLDPAMLTPADLAVLARRGISADASADSVAALAAGLGDAGLLRLAGAGTVSPFHRLVLIEAAATRGLIAPERLAGGWLAAAAAERSAALSGAARAGEARPERLRARQFAAAAAERNPAARLFGIATLVRAAAGADPLMTAAAAGATAPLLDPAVIRGLDPDSRIDAARLALAGGGVDAAAAMLGAAEDRPAALTAALADDGEFTALALVAFEDAGAVLGVDVSRLDMGPWLGGLAGPAREVATAAIGLFAPEALPLPTPDAGVIEGAMTPVPAVWFALRAAADGGRLGETAALALMLLEARPEAGAIGIAGGLEGLRLAGLDTEARRLAVEMMIAAGAVSGLAPGV